MLKSKAKIPPPHRLKNVLSGRKDKHTAGNVQVVYNEDMVYHVGKHETKNESIEKTTFVVN